MSGLISASISQTLAISSSLLLSVFWIPFLEIVFLTPLPGGAFPFG